MTSGKIRPGDSINLSESLTVYDRRITLSKAIFQEW